MCECVWVYVCVSHLLIRKNCSLFAALVSKSRRAMGSLCSSYKHTQSRHVHTHTHTHTHVFPGPSLSLSTYYLFHLVLSLRFIVFGFWLKNDRSVEFWMNFQLDSFPHVFRLELPAAWRQYYRQFTVNREFSWCGQLTLGFQQRTVKRKMVRKSKIIRKLKTRIFTLHNALFESSCPPNLNRFSPGF